MFNFDITCCYENKEGCSATVKKKKDVVLQRFYTFMTHILLILIGCTSYYKINVQVHGNKIGKKKFIFFTLDTILFIITSSFNLMYTFFFKI